MRNAFVVIFIFLIGNALAQTAATKNQSKQNDYRNKNRISTLVGHQVSFYLNHPQIDSHSKMFFKGELAISNNAITYGILDSVLTKNEETRPFYFFIFNQIVDLSDEKMLNLVSSKCLEFVETYPCEYFTAFNEQDIDINVVKWTTFIGQALKDKNRFATFRSVVDTKINGSCSGIQDLWKSFRTEVRMCLIQ
ncbi:MAG: hypothetical protein HOO91_09770 [Bacteroidales bacterium]|nr:hypothetical protein [Bacteroidales bacterium]